MAHVFAREGTCEPLHAVPHEHHVSFWVPPGDRRDDAFRGLAAAVAEECGIVLAAAAPCDAYACPRTGRCSVTYRVVLASGARACSRARSSDIAGDLARRAAGVLGFEARSYVV